MQYGAAGAHNTRPPDLLFHPALPLHLYNVGWSRFRFLRKYYFLMSGVDQKIALLAGAEVG